MTKREFFAARAQAEYLKHAAVTTCPPGEADGSETPRGAPRRTQWRYLYTPTGALLPRKAKA